MAQFKWTPVEHEHESRHLDDGRDARYGCRTAGSVCSTRSCCCRIGRQACSHRFDAIAWLTASSPEAPGRFSTTTCCPSRADKRCAQWRQLMWKPPSAENPTSNLMGCEG